ncbi:MAG: hypothetical protein RQ899_02620 [Pseudomonadales bacterium]|nr:hypothetical protein [Pseudomonadales bacterium]
MKIMHSLLRLTTWSFAVTGLFAVLVLKAQAAPLVMLAGKAPDARYEDKSQIRISILRWSEEAQAKAVEQAFSEYQSSHDQKTFADLLEEQETLGYLFSGAATGYTVKYAYQDSADEKMVLLLTPGLKTRNPSLWQTRNESAVPFTLVELAPEGEQYTVKTSLDSTDHIGTAADGRLQLDTANAATFATVADSRPYYLKGDS